MLRSRITPCLLVHKKGLVKTVEFGNPKYVGDPINAVKIFNILSLYFKTYHFRLEQSAFHVNKKFIYST